MIATKLNNISIPKKRMPNYLKRGKKVPETISMDIIHVNLRIIFQALLYRIYQDFKPRIEKN
jgi:hypothetical protein